MGRIHRYLQTKDCLIFNFVATKHYRRARAPEVTRKIARRFATLSKTTRLFNVVGEILPPNENRAHPFVITTRGKKGGFSGGAKFFLGALF